MSTPTQERRRHPRQEARTSTFVHRRVGDDRAVLRVDMADLAIEGVGIFSFAPLPVGGRIAVGLGAPNAQPEMVLCNVKHCTKVAGQFRTGAEIIEHLPGEPMRTVIPPRWFENLN